MLGNADVMAVLAVKDMEEGKQFYGETLGLKIEKEDPHFCVYRSDTSRLQVYESAENAGTNQATAATWEVGDIEAEVEELKGKGVQFEHYEDLPGTTLEGDLHVMDGEKAAWFKDPAGNILCLHTEA